MSQRAITLALTLAVAVALALGLAPAAARAGRWEAIEQIPGQKPVAVLVEGKPRNYFRIAAGTPLILELKGPIRLRVVSRPELPLDSKQPVSYHLSVLEGSKALDEQRTESSASGLARLAAGDRAVGKSRRMVVTIPAGSHRVALAVDGTAAVLVRLLQGAPRSEEEMVTLTPLVASRAITCLEGEKTIPYFSIMPGKPVRMRVVGPTSLDLITRLDFDPTMRGTQVYRLKISDGDRPLREVEFTTTKATTASYPDLPDRVPSKFDRVQLPIDDGQHEISIELMKPLAGSAEIHPRIPQPSVGNEE